MRSKNRSVQVSELKASLSKYLARVKAGEVIVVTERGKPVAKLVPVPRHERAELVRMRELERRGLVRVGTGLVPDRFWEMPLPDDPQGLVLKALLEERETGR